MPTLRKMGNSKGMIFPKPVLDKAGLPEGTKFDVDWEDGMFTARPVRKVREGWEEDAAKIGALPLTEEEQDWMAFGNEGDDELEW